MDRLGYDTLWLAEHHFQYEGYECLPNILMCAVHLAHVTKQLKIGCGFNIAPMWHPLRMAEDFATADILTKGRTVFGVGRGYHTREVETFGSPMLDQNANRELFEEQVEIMFKAFNNESFSHKGKHYTLPPEVPYRGYQLKELTPGAAAGQHAGRMLAADRQRQPARPRFHGSGTTSRARSAAAPRRCRPGRSRAISDAAARAGRDLKLGENLMLGVHGIVAKTREEARARPDADLRGARQDVRAARLCARTDPGAGRGGCTARRLGRAPGVPKVEHFMKLGSWFAGTPDDLVVFLKGIEEKYPGHGAHQLRLAADDAEGFDA